MFFGGCAETIMIKNGLYSLIAVAIDGVDVEVGGVLILRDGQIHGGDSFVFYTGTYDSSDGNQLQGMDRRSRVMTVLRGWRYAGLVVLRLPLVTDCVEKVLFR